MTRPDYIAFLLNYGHNYDTVCRLSLADLRRLVASYQE